jgi:Predicted acetyltransferase
VKVDSYLSSNTGDIKQLFTSVFTDSEGTSEGVLIGQLVHDIVTLTHKEDLHGYVAIDNDKIIGCLFFTRLSFQQGLSAFLLSPMAIQTSYRGQGLWPTVNNYCP